jgi:hypothetical protein
MSFVLTTETVMGRAAAAMATLAVAGARRLLGGASKHRREERQ